MSTLHDHLDLTPPGHAPRVRASALAHTCAFFDRYGLLAGIYYVAVESAKDIPGMVPTSGRALSSAFGRCAMNDWGGRDY